MNENVAQAPSFFDTSLFLLIGMVFIIYFMLIRPQNKRAKALKEMLGALEVGDEVIAANGILGKVQSISGDYVSIEVSENVKFKLQKASISGTLPKGTIDSINK